jgi:hypothetical protein
MEVLAILAAFLLCIVLPVALVVALIVWLLRPRAKAAQQPEQALALGSRVVADEFEQLLNKWQASGQLGEASVVQLRALLAQERGAPAQLIDTPAAPAISEPIAAPQDNTPANAAPAATGIASAPGPIAEPDSAAAPVPAIVARSFGERFGSALLSLRTRQTVLFLGAFLLLISALILIVFNWASFPPILQFALLAGVCGGFWAGGAWLIAQTELDRAGVGLQAVGGLLVPVVTFSISRPGLLELAPRAGWLLASALCLPIYVLAAWRLRRVLFAVTACISLASAVLAALGGVDNQWLPSALAITLAGYLPIAGWLRRRAPDLAAGPRWVAQIGTPLALLAGTLLLLSDNMSLGAFAVLLWSIAVFYALAAWLDRYSLWAWCAAVAAPAALLVSLSSSQALADEWLPLALIAALVLYLPAAAWLRGQAPTLATAPFWTAQTGTALALVVVVTKALDSQIAFSALAATLWAGAAFYLLALLLDRQMVWYWVATLLPPYALLASLAALEPGAPWWGVALALMALGYIGLALTLEPRLRANALAAYVGAAMLMLMSGAAMIASPVTARWALPLLIAGMLAITLAYHRGRLTWLTEDNRLLAATLGIAGAGALLAAWALALLDLTGFGSVERGLILTAMAALYLIGAANWPGSVRRSYDWALQVLGVTLALAGGMLVYSRGGYYVAHALTVLAAIWLFQALRHRNSYWAIITLGTALGSGVGWLLWVTRSPLPEEIVALALAFAAIYLIGGALLRHGAWRYWSAPALGWGTLAAILGLLFIVGNIQTLAGPQAWHVLAVLALTAVVALSGALWRAAWSGFVVAALLVFATLLAADRGFFTTWQPLDADFGYIICGITLGLALLGQVLRRFDPRYAYPYEIVGFALLTFAPLPTIRSDAQHATLVWAGMLALYALASWLYRLRWASGLALLALDMAVLNGSAWLIPDGRPAGAGLTLLVAAWLQGLLGLWWSRKVNASANPLLYDLQPAYVVALISGFGGLAIGSRAVDVLAIVAFGLAALLALVGTAHRREDGAWGTLVLLAIGFAALHRFVGIEPTWSIAWGVAEALGLCLLGWAIEPRTKNQEPDANSIILVLGSRFLVLSIWQRPLSVGPLMAGTTLTAALLWAAVVGQNLPPLTFALATLALLLATLAVRRRASMFAYATGASLTAAGLFQLYDWGFRQPQWFVIPAGLYLLALAEGLRRFQGRRRLSQLTETGALVLLLGVSFGQSLRAEGLESQMYAAGMCVEALLLLGYGVLAKLRAPFLGGVGFFVAGVLWLSVDPLMAMNKWVLLGLMGLLLVGVYVLLERRQQELARAGRALIERVSSWS